MLTLVLWGVLIVARGVLYGVDVAVGHREASDLGAVLVTLALSFAAQNTVTARRMNAARPLPAAQPVGGGQPGEPSRRPQHGHPALGWLLTIASLPAWTNASRPAGRNDENAGKRAAGSDARADTWATGPPYAPRPHRHAPQLIIEVIRDVAFHYIPRLAQAMAHKPMR